MSTLLPVTVNLPAARAGDPRVGHLLGQDPEAAQRPAAVLVGFPCEIGVLRNGGRPGAAQGPAAIRECLYRLTPDPRNPAHRRLLEQTIDLGDVPVENDLRAAQQQLADVIAPWLDRQVPVMVMGGGHETAYGHFLGYVNNRTPVAIVNLDAHADVRELLTLDGAARGHSGSPFRQAAEHPSALLRRYDVFGLQAHSLAAPHLQYLDALAGKWRMAEDTTLTGISKAYGRSSSTMATFCLDAVDQSQAPGVSAPACAGLSASLWLQAAEAAGACDKVQSMDVVELSPPHDRDQQTARLAALTLWRFLRGVSQRQ